MDFGVHLSPIPPYRHPRDEKLQLRSSGPGANLILVGFWDDLRFQPGPSGPLSRIFFDTRVTSLQVLFEPPSRWAPRPVWERRIDKQLAFWESLDVVGWI